MMDKEEFTSKKFADLKKKMLSKGLTDSDLLCIQVPKDLIAVKKYNVAMIDVLKCNSKYIMCLSAIGFVILAIILSFYWSLLQDKISALYFALSDLDPKGEKCLLPMPDSAVDISRPPVDCSICRGMTSVDRVKNISSEEFEKYYAYSGKPVVIADAMMDWSASNIFSFEFFKSIYAEDSPVFIHSAEQNCQFFPYKTKFRNLAEVFNMSQERAELRDGSEPWYIGWSNCDSTAANVLRQHYQLPAFLPSAAESSKTDWIFMGSPGYGAHMHIDHVGKPSWQAQVTGIKLWTLQPPPECYFECADSIDVTVNTGEIIILDTNIWYHGTKIIGKDMSITIGSEYD